MPNDGFVIITELKNGNFSAVPTYAKLSVKLAHGFLKLDSSVPIFLEIMHTMFLASYLNETGFNIWARAYNIS